MPRAVACHLLRKVAAMAKNRSYGLPRGSKLGRPTKDNPLGVITLETALSTSNRAQRREYERQAKRAAAKGDPDAKHALPMLIRNAGGG